MRRIRAPAIWLGPAADLSGSFSPRGRRWPVGDRSDGGWARTNLGRCGSLIAAVLIAFAAVAAPAWAQDAAKGADIYQDRCGSCHVLNGIGQGPTLVGVLGRKAGSAPGFAYSDAIKASGLVWTPANLDRFLTGPAKLVPGTAMRATVPDPVERRDLIAYLATLKR